METKYEFVRPGTAGLATRIPAKEEKYSIQEMKENLYILRPNEVMPCGQNQY